MNGGSESPGSMPLKTTLKYGVVSCIINGSNDPEQMHKEDIIHNYFGMIYVGPGRTKPLGSNDPEATELANLNEQYLKTNKDIRTVTIKMTIDLKV